MARSIFTDAYRRLLQILVHERRAAEVSQAELARRVEQPQSWVSKYERGERRLDVVELIAIAAALGTRASALIAQIEGDTNDE